MDSIVDASCFREVGLATNKEPTFGFDTSQMVNQCINNKKQQVRALRSAQKMNSEPIVMYTVGNQLSTLRAYTNSSRNGFTALQTSRWLHKN